MSKSVLYVTSSSGVNVRATPGGSIVRSIGQNTLLIKDSADAPVVVSSHTWIKVTYYYANQNDSVAHHSATGWVAQEYTATVSTSTPVKADTLSSNSTLNQKEMLTNARYIFNYLRSLSTTIRWAKNPICGMLGNMEAESSINPGRWQNGVSNPSNGYGLTQWTPSTKLTSWTPSDSTKTGIDKQIERIIYEVAHESEQWVSSQHSPAMTFSQYSKSTKTVSVLAEYFLRCYEQPNNVSSKVTERKNCANKWYAFLSAIGDL